MKTLRSLWHGLLVVAALGAAACSADPMEAKQEALAAGNTYFEQARYTEASLEYRKALQVDPLYAEARYKLAQTYEVLGDRLNTLREYVRAADLMPDDPEVQTRAGTLLLMAGAFDDARSRALKALQQNPKHMEANLLLAQALAQLKDLDEAVKHIEGTIQADPSDARAVINLAGLQQAKGDIQRAESQFLRAAALDPKSIPAALALGRFYLSTGRGKESEEWLKKAIALAPRDPTANRALAGVYLSTNRFNEAEAPLKASIEGGPPAQKLILADYYMAAQRHKDARAILDAVKNEPAVFAETRVRFSMLEWREGRRANAHAQVDEILKQTPKDAGANLLKGRYLIADGKFEAARDLLKISIATDSRRSGSHYLLGTAYRALGDLESARKEFSESLQLLPSQVGSKLQLAQLDLLAGNLEAAEATAIGAVQAAPANGEARLVLTDVFIARNKLGDALQHATFLAGRLPTLPQPQMHLGRIYYKQRDYASAERAFKRAMELSKGSAEAFGGLVETLIAAGQIQQARQMTEERLARNPKDTAALLVASEVYKAARDTRKAEAALKEVLAAEPTNMNAYIELTRIFMAEQRMNDARTQLEALVATQPKAVWAHTIIAMSLHVENRKAEAKERYERILQIDSKAAIAANNLANILLEEGRELDRALELAVTAKQQLPDHPDINDTLGWVYSKKGLGSLAVPPLELSVSKQPSNPLYRYHLGEAYVQTGQRLKARQALEQALASPTRFEGRDDARKTLTRLTSQ